MYTHVIGSNLNRSSQLQLGARFRTVRREEKGLAHLMATASDGAGVEEAGVRQEKQYAPAEA